ncbi:hypothetical protein [Demequina litorisediminis]|uniref:hypothetical protein n=1 Tax=Demequina litorisediminis TaxID=1849022 RepID=UPI0024E0A453|nr:hypothetical protein [Demequina litorisediminis]
MPIDLAVEMVAGAIGVATRGHWSFDEKRKPKGSPAPAVKSSPSRSPWQQPRSPRQRP